MIFILILYLQIPNNRIGFLVRTHLTSNIDILKLCAAVVLKNEAQHLSKLYGLPPNIKMLFPIIRRSTLFPDMKKIQKYELEWAVALF